MDITSAEKYCLTIDQVKELEKLGISFKNTEFAYIISLDNNIKSDYELVKFNRRYKEDLIPTPSVYSLLNKIPKKIIVEKETYIFNLEFSNNFYFVEYINDNTNSILINIDRKLVRDALFGIIKWLKTNKLI